MMSHSNNVPTRVRQIAKLIRQMDSEERRWLLQLVPELAPARISESQKELYAYFEPRLQRLADVHPMTDDDPFVAGLSVGQFFALPEEQQLQVWNKAHAKAEHELSDREFTSGPVRILLDKNIVRAAIVGLRHGARRPLSPVEFGALYFWRESNRCHPLRLCLSPLPLLTFLNCCPFTLKYVCCWNRPLFFGRGLMLDVGGGACAKPPD